GEVLGNQKTRFAGKNLEAVARHSSADSPEQLVHWLDELLCAAPLSEQAGKQLVDVVRQSTGDRSRQIATLIHTLSALPQFQLA
ncbi:MAG: hypothetical protein VB858_21925, partial [Planctomycetaceae bacterium]